MSEMSKTTEEINPGDRIMVGGSACTVMRTIKYMARSPLPVEFMLLTDDGTDVRRRFPPGQVWGLL